MDKVIEVSGLSFGYTFDAILKDVTFSVGQGEFVGIIGVNGAGKSTLLKLLLGELEPQQGEVRLWGKGARQFHDWPWIGYVPQNSAVLASGFPANAAEIVGANLYSRIGPFRLTGKGHREQVRKALETVGMADFAGHMIGELSGGQLQRVMLARALIAKPRLLLLDEPSTGVDAGSAEGLYRMLLEQNAKGMTVIMVTHDLERASQCLQRAICLEHGTTVELDREQLLHELEHRHKHP